MHQTSILGTAGVSNSGPTMQAPVSLSHNTCVEPLLLALLQVIDITYDVSAGPDGLLPAIKDVCAQAQVSLMKDSMQRPRPWGLWVSGSG